MVEFPAVGKAGNCLDWIALVCHCCLSLKRFLHFFEETRPTQGRCRVYYRVYAGYMLWPVGKLTYIVKSFQAVESITEDCKDRNDGNSVEFDLGKDSQRTKDQGVNVMPWGGENMDGQ